MRPLAGTCCFCASSTRPPLLCIIGATPRCTVQCLQRWQRRMLVNLHERHAILPTDRKWNKAMLESETALWYRHHRTIHPTCVIGGWMRRVQNQLQMWRCKMLAIAMGLTTQTCLLALQTHRQAWRLLLLQTPLFPLLRKRTTKIDTLIKLLQTLVETQIFKAQPL